MTEVGATLGRVGGWQLNAVASGPEALKSASADSGAISWRRSSVWLLSGETGFDALGGARAVRAEPALLTEVAAPGHMIHLDADAVRILEQERVVARREL